MFKVMVYTIGLLLIIFKNIVLKNKFYVTIDFVNTNFIVIKLVTFFKKKNEKKFVSVFFIDYIISLPLLFP